MYLAQMYCNPLAFSVKQCRQAECPWNITCNQDSVEMPKFVAQEHHARTHRFDFRLEKDGVYKSWAVPKEIPEAPGAKRLTVRAGDHDLAFGDFEGQIPEGQYGAGKVRIWDKGPYDPEEWTDQRIAFSLHGGQASGRFNLIRLTQGKPNEWLISKRSQS